MLSPCVDTFKRQVLNTNYLSSVYKVDDLPVDTIMATFHLANLYTNILNKLGLEASKFALNQMKILGINHLIKLIETFKDGLDDN